MLVSVSLPSVFRQPTAHTTPNYCALSSLCFWALSREGKFIKRLTKARFVLCLPGARVVHRLLTQQCWRHASVPTGLHSSCDRQERQVPCPTKPGPGLSPAGYAGMGSPGVQAVPLLLSRASGPSPSCQCPVLILPGNKRAVCGLLGH